jgi:hypothetical protein
MSKPITVTLSHELGREAARERIRSGFDSAGSALGGAFKIEQAWAGDVMTFTARAVGQIVSGKLEVRDKDVVIEVVLPGLLAGLANRISSKMKQKATLLLEKK